MRFFTIVLLILLGLQSAAQDNVDSTITIDSNPFFHQLISREGKIYIIAGYSEFKGISMKSPILKSLGFELLKLPGKSLFLHFLRSGKLYKLDTSPGVDSSLVFRRIDDTWNYNYNIGATLFSVGNDIYEIGGYGFWKSNGILRKFNFKDQEWDVILLNQEIFPQEAGKYGAISWIDSTERFFYVPFQRIVNDGLIDQGDGKDFVLDGYRLDINKRRWEYLGKTNKEVFNIFKNASIVFPTTSGILLCYTSRVYHIDYTSNHISVYDNPSLAQSLSRLNNSFFRYYTRDWVYWYNHNNSLYDSIFIDKRKFTLMNIPVWEKHWSSIEIAGSAFFILSLLGLIFWWRSRKQAAIMAEEQKALSSSLASHPFSETELALLLLLVEKTGKGSTANISEINYVLGIKDKNPGMQKKVRSDVINSVNEKFRLLHKGHAQIIQSIRSEADKRYFEYLINRELVADLKKLIE